MKRANYILNPKLYLIIKLNCKDKKIDSPLLIVVPKLIIKQ